jgi:curved DNA-binding protein CbpA
LETRIKEEFAVAEEFVDLYEVLDLPLDADRNTVRKRVNELYLEAQRNLDHRDFKTRVKFQELFEITLPQARYILLDEARRDDYDRLVRASRAPHGTPPPTALGSGKTEGFKVAAGPDDSLPGAAPALDPLPEVSVDPAQLARERDELWQKWKSGLEEVLSDEGSDESKRLKPVARTPRREPSSPPATSTSAAASSATTNSPSAQPIEFNFGGNAAPQGGVSHTQSFENKAEQELAAKEVEARRADHRREIMKEILIGVGLKWMLIGAAAVAVPGVALMLWTMRQLYPLNGPSPVPYNIPSVVVWLLFFLVIGLGAYAVGRLLSKKMRRKTVAELSMLSYEDLLRTTNQG